MLEVLAVLLEWPDPECETRRLVRQAALRALERDVGGCIQHLREALTEAERTVGSGHPQALGIAGHLSCQLHYAGQAAEANALLRQALAAGEAVPGTAGARANLTVQLAAQCGAHDREQSEALLREYRALRDEADDEDDDPGPQPTTEVERLIFDGIECLFENELDAAVDLFVEARDLGLRTLGATHPHTLRAYSELAGMEFAQGRLRRAEEQWCYVLDLCARGDADSVAATAASVLEDLASLESLRGDHAAAEHYYRRAHAVWRQQGEPERNHRQLAECLAFQGRIDEARILFREWLLEILDRWPDVWLRSHQLRQWWLIAYFERPDANEIELCLKSLDFRVDRLSIDETTVNTWAIRSLDEKAALLRALDREREADESAARATALRRELLARDVD